MLKYITSLFLLAQLPIALSYTLGELKFGSAKLSHPQKLKTHLKYTEKDTLSLSVSVKRADGVTAPPEQVVLSLKPQDGGASVYFVVPAEGKATGASDSFVLSVDLDTSSQDEFQNRNGTYDATLLVGNRDPAAALSWPLGAVEFAFVPTNFWLAKIAGAEDSLWSQRPIILHMHDAPAKRAHSVMAIAFTGVIVAAPWLFLLGSLGSGRVSIIPSSFKHLLFVACLAGMVAVLFLYWISLPFFHTLLLIGVLWLIALLFRPRDDAFAPVRGHSTTDTPSSKKVD